jgi:hypothetical protein
MLATAQRLASPGLRPSAKLWLAAKRSDNSDPSKKDDEAVEEQADDLPYQVEIWNEEKSAVQQVVAITVNASIGYAAYYEATKEYPERYITLRYKNRVVARWNNPRH